MFIYIYMCVYVFIYIGGLYIFPSLPFSPLTISSTLSPFLFLSLSPFLRHTHKSQKPVTFFVFPTAKFSCARYIYIYIYYIYIHIHNTFLVAPCQNVILPDLEAECGRRCVFSTQYVTLFLALSSVDLSLDSLHLSLCLSLPLSISHFVYLSLSLYL